MPNEIPFQVQPPRTMRGGRDRELARRKAVEAESVDQLRSLFLAGMPHQLRTPLNAVIGFSDLLLQDRATLSPEQAHALEDILASGRRLLALINPFVDLARLEAGRLLLELDPLDPAEQVRDACALAAPVARKKRIRFQQEPGGPYRPLLADRRHLQHVLLQLLANSICFSPEGSRIALRVEELDGQVRFEVRNPGAGLPEGAQADRGLAIARRLVERQGGELHLEAAPSGGATVRFTLPASGAAALAKPVVPSRRTGAVLVVDDDPTNRALARVLLERRGYRVVLADSGAEAVRLARSEPCALVLMDLAMPLVDGFETARQLLSDPATASIPLIAFTALVGDGERVRRAGFAGHLSKPIETAALEATLKRFVDPAVRA